MQTVNKISLKKKNVIQLYWMQTLFTLKKKMSDLNFLKATFIHISINKDTVTMVYMLYIYVQIPSIRCYNLLLVFFYLK